AESTPRCAVIVEARIDTDLNRCGAAHHEPAPVAVTIEELLHRRIAGKLKYTVRAAERINAAACEGEAGVPERLVQDREVAARHGDTVAEVLRWSCAELDLTAWLQGQVAGSGQDARFLKRVEYLLNPVEWHRQQGV